MTSTNNSRDDWLIPESPITFEYLTKFNRNMGILHLIQGILMILLGFFLDFSRPIYTFYLKFEIGPPLVIEPNPQVFFTFELLGVFVGSFLLLSAIAHLLIAYPLNKSYIRNLKRGINKVRWFEYALSSSIMIVLIAIFFGVWDFWSLFMIFMANAIMNMFGLMMELHNVYTREKNEKVKWTAFILGCIIGAVPWIVITFYFVSTQTIGGEIPWFVYWIYGVEMFFFFTFAFNMVLQYKGVGKWKDYLYGERVYQLLSLISKTFLAWFVFAGVLSPS
jgi:hypothetical protein